MKQSSTLLTLLVLVVLACVFVADMYGVLPEPLQSQLSSLSGVFGPHHASKPYLEKFEGAWQVTLEDGMGNTGNDCVGGTAEAQVHDGAFSAAVLTQAHISRKVSATVAPDGSLSGSIVVGPSINGSIMGSVEGSDGRGTWTDDYGCRGTFTLSKQGPVVDPTLGKLANYTGHVSILRGTTTLAAFPGMPLYLGDQVSAQDGQAVLSFGVYPPTVVTVTDGRTYTVPAKP